jgi:hypothetical protein
MGRQTLRNPWRLYPAATDERWIGAVLLQHPAIIARYSDNSLNFK